MEIAKLAAAQFNSIKFLWLLYIYCLAEHYSKKYKLFYRNELNLPLEKKKKQKEFEEKYILTMVVGKDAAQTPSRLSVRSSTPDATT